MGEPTGPCSDHQFLALTAQAQIMGSLSELAQGRTSVFVAHRLSTVKVRARGLSGRQGTGYGAPGHGARDARAQEPGSGVRGAKAQGPGSGAPGPRVHRAQGWGATSVAWLCLRAWACGAPAAHRQGVGLVGRVEGLQRMKGPEVSLNARMCTTSNLAWAALPRPFRHACTQPARGCGKLVAARHGCMVGQ